MKKEEIIEYAIILLISILAFNLIFNNLGSSTFFDWDESHYGEVALEILKTGDWIMLKYGGQPDSKPPLGAWLIAISFKIFGINEFALRFWSASFGIITILLVYFFGSEIKDNSTGIYSALILLTTEGFIGYHGARTGDYDVIFTFFITLSLYFFYLGQKRTNGLFLIGSAIAIALAVLVKGVIGLFPAVIIIIYLLIYGSLKMTFLSKETVYAIISFLVVVIPLFLYRFINEKYFFIKIYKYHLLKRFNEPVEGHVGDWSFYFEVLKSVYGKILLILILMAFIYSLYLTYKKNKPISLLVIWIFVILAVFTAARTKIFWYIIPLYPAISLLIAYKLSILQEFFVVKKSSFMLIFLILMVFPYLAAMESTQSVIISPHLHTIKELKGKLQDIDVLYIHADEFRQSTFLYLNSYVRENVSIYYDIRNVNATIGDGIITFNSSRYNFLINESDYKLIKAKRLVAVFKKIR